MSRIMLVLCLSIAASAAAAADAPRVAGERSRAAPPPKVLWRHAPADEAMVSRIRWPELAVARLAALDSANRNRNADRRRPLQIGVGRVATLEKAGGAGIGLRWRAVPGGQSATFAITSPVAMGLRVGLALQGLPANAELRIRGSELPLGDIVLVRAAEAARSTGPDGLYWTPATDGETQTVELFVPAGADIAPLRVSAPELNHLVTNSRRNFKIIEKIGESGSCNIDTACRVGALGQNFVLAKDAVAHMMFNLYSTGGSSLGSYICTGTLLNDTDPATQVPLFFSADHCFAGDSGTIPAQDRAQVAASLVTYWNYEASACGSLVPTSRTTLTGGADVLFHDEYTDAMLLRLRSPAPSIAAFAGWDAGGLAANADVVAIHHPSGDAKKVSFGRNVPADSDASSHAVGWTTGTTEPGSSGSGLFVLGTDGHYRLHGGLHGGYAACPNAGNLDNEDNRDWYSRLDVVFPEVRQFLAPEAPAGPRRRNGSQPLAPR